MSFDNLSDKYKAYICSVALIPEPTSFKQTKNFSEWPEAMNEELKALERNSTWIVCFIPPGKRAIRCRWIYKIKVNADGTIERYETRLVAREYTQEEGINFC